MNINTFFTAITVVSLFISTSASAHDPSKHTASKEKPNCEAMHKIDSSEMDMNDPVMQAMMKQCGKPDMEDHHDKQDEKPACTEAHAKMGHCTLPVDKKPVCTEEHAKMGHCTLEADASGDKQAQPSNDLPPVVLKNTVPAIGHDAPMDPSAPSHERADHQKVYEIPDCENMANMHHSSADGFDPIIQELMKKCEDAEAAEKKSIQEASKDHASDEHD